MPSPPALGVWLSAPIIRPPGKACLWQTSATYVDTNLEPSTQYTYKVKARGLSHWETAYSSTANATTAAIGPVDTDGDGVADDEDDFPNDPIETTDTDGDGLGDNAETGTGVYVSPTNTGTQANNADSDGDGISDGDEVSAGSDPNDTNDPVAVSVPALPLLGLGVLAAVLVLMGSRAFAPQRE